MSFSKISLVLITTGILAFAQRPAQSSQVPNNTSQSSKASSSSAGSNLSSADQMFIENTYMDGQKEVAIGMLAEQRGSDQKVKDYGRMLVNDHQKANQELESLARQKGVTLNAQSKSADNELSRLSGAEFDKAFAKQMVADHEKAISNFEQEEKSTKDSDLRNFTSKTLPTLRTHLDHAKSLPK